MAYSSSSSNANSKMSKRDKSGLGYGDQVHDGVLSYENEVFQSVFDSRSSDVEDSPVHDRFANDEGMHAVPPPMNRNYIPSGPDREIDDSMFTYGPKQSKTSESDTQTRNYMPYGPDIEIDYSQFTYGPKQTQTSESETQTSDFDTCESDCSVEAHESLPEPVVNEPKVVNQPKIWSDAPIIKEYESDSEDEHVSLPTEKQETPSFANQQVKTPRETVKNQFTHSKNPKVDKKGLGYGFTTKAWFLCVILSHLIRDCDFHEKRMANRQRPFNNTTALYSNFSKQKVNTAEVNAVSAVGGKRETAVKPSAGCNWRPKRHYWHKDYPHRTFQNKGIVDSGCSRHMTRNKAYLAEYQDFNGGPVAFGGSKGYITGKGKIKIGKLDFEDVCFVKELQHFNLFYVSQICDKKNKVLFTDSECLVLSPEFKLPDANQVLPPDKAIWIKREYSNARTPQQNGVAERKNRTLIEAARTMLADSFLPNTFWAEAGKLDEGFLVGYSLQSKAFRVYNLETKRVEENLHITFLENKPNVAGKGPTWLFDLDYLTDSMNYQPMRSENQANKHAGPQEANQNAGTEDNIDAGDSKIEAESTQDYFVLPIWSSSVKSSKANNTAEALRKEFAQETEDLLLQAGAAKASSTNILNTASTLICTASPYGGLSFIDLTNTDQDDSEIPALEEIYDNPTDDIFTNSSYDDEGAVADSTNLELVVNVSPIPTLRINFC
ncbi:ribonuclease H-like domain-containing protein [Tanacetum coccineum]